MSSGCGDVLSLADLQTAKKHQIFEAEVITGKSGGVAGGADIDYATNQVTGQTQKTLPAVVRDIGLKVADFTFESGGTLETTDVGTLVLWPESTGGDNNYYQWLGAYPKTIPASSSPTSTGGISPTAWKAVMGVQYLLAANALSELVTSGVEFESADNLGVTGAVLSLWDNILRPAGFNVVGFMTNGTSVSDAADALIAKDFSGAYVFSGTLPHVVVEGVDTPTNPLWLKVSHGLPQGSRVSIENALPTGSFFVNRDADFLVQGQIPGAYNRLNRNFSDGQNYEYASKKFHKETFGIFEDACVLSAIACERDLERPTQILGASTGKLVAQYGSTDTAATYFENYALPPVFTASSATYGATSAANLTGLDTSKLRLNMVAVVTGTSTWFGLVRGWTNDSITVDGWYKKKSGTAGTPSGSLSISPVYRVWGNNTIVTVPEDAAATSAVGMEVMLNLYKDGTGSNSQAYKAINNNAINPDEIADSAYHAVGKFGKAHDVWPGSTYSYRSWGATSYGFFSDHDQSGIKILTPNDAAFVLASQVGGVGAETNVLIIDPAGSIIQTNQKAVNGVAARFGPNGAAGVTIRQQGSGGANGSDAVMFVGKSSATNRSINCAGTVNSSGADYAEYFYKSDSCGEIAKGDICGINKDGEITDKYAEALSFMIKSTDPCMVGGDVWSTEERPQYPSAEWEEWSRLANTPAPTAPDKSILRSFMSNGMDETSAKSAYDALINEYKNALLTWEASIAELKSNEPDKESDEYKQWLVKLEQSRSRVDRLAYCGRVPVNIAGGVPGDYLVPVASETGEITGKFVTNPTFEEYRAAIGKVYSNSPGGKTIVSVLVH